ncbi:MAG: hypothetical protein HQK65_08815 [Desulfamplus sp.]|nr:hypothetical protein [Desulfamplus sp.]
MNALKIWLKNIVKRSSKEEVSDIAAQTQIFPTIEEKVMDEKETSANMNENISPIWKICSQARIVSLLILFGGGILYGELFNEMDRLRDFVFGILFFWFPSGELLKGWVSGEVHVKGTVLSREKNEELFIFFLFFMGFLSVASLVVTILILFNIRP